MQRQLVHHPAPGCQPGKRPDGLRQDPVRLSRGLSQCPGAPAQPGAASGPPAAGDVNTKPVGCITWPVLFFMQGQLHLILVFHKTVTYRFMGPLQSGQRHRRYKHSPYISRRHWRAALSAQESCSAWRAPPTGWSGPHWRRWTGSESCPGCRGILPPSVQNTQEPA